MAEDVVLKDEERQKCEIWTRVMGYHRPVENFNIGKKGEHEERLHFNEVITCGNLEVRSQCCCGAN